MRRLDREERNLRAAVDWALAHDDTDDRAADHRRRPGAGIQQRGRLREAPCAARAAPRRIERRRPPGADRRAGGRRQPRVLDGRLHAAARAAYEERLELATASGDPVAHGRRALRRRVPVDGRQRGRPAPGARAAGARPVPGGRPRGRRRSARARRSCSPCSWPATTARRSTSRPQNLEAFSREGSEFEVADSLTLLSAISWRLGDVALAWRRASRGAAAVLGHATARRGSSRNLGMAAIIQLADGDPELGARIAGATYRLVREKGVMLAPVKVLHLPDPVGPRERAPRRGAGGGAARRGRGDAGRGRRRDRVRDPGARADRARVRRPRAPGRAEAGSAPRPPRGGCPTRPASGRPSPGCWASWMTVPAAPSTGLGIA